MSKTSGKRHQRPWMPQEHQRAIRLKNEGLTYSEIGKAIARSRISVEQKLRFDRDLTRHSRIQSVQRFEPSEAALKDRDRRSMIEHPNITAAFFGDPLPGYSMLDRAVADGSVWRHVHAQSDDVVL